MKATVGMQVEGYRSQCIGVIIEATRYLGTITKVNKKSIRVQLHGMCSTSGKKEKGRFPMNTEVTYTFWKTTSDGRDLYRSEGRLHGIITL